MRASESERERGPQSDTGSGTTCNIGDRGARRRRLGGVVWLAIAVGAWIALMATHSPRIYRLALELPFLMAALGFLQASAKT